MYLTSIWLIDNTIGILETVLGMALFKKSKYIALACLAKCPGLAPVLLEMEPNLGQELLQVAKDPSLFNQVLGLLNIDYWLRPFIDNVINS